MGRKKILFFSHAVTMAHFARPLKWIELLDKNVYDIYLASNPIFQKFAPKEEVTFIPASGIEPQKFLEILEKSGNIYDTKTFNEHVAEDLKIISEVKPDLVIGDYRLSLSVSCRQMNVKYINITNAYWSPNAVMKFPLPESPIIRLLGERISRAVYALLRPLILKINFTKMAGQLKKALGNVDLKFNDFRQAVTDGDITLYCDSVQLVPLKKQNNREQFIGPILWSMPVALPNWWGELNSTRKKIFVTLGSSGNADVLPMLLNTLSQLDADIVVALAGKADHLPKHKNVFVTDYLPMEEACRNASLVICNGGSPVAHTALSHGVPILGVICNNDQLLNMAHIEKFGAGKMLRYWNITPKAVLSSVQDLIEKPTFKIAATAMAREFASMNVDQKLRQIIDENV